MSEFQSSIKDILESGRAFNIRFFVINQDIEKKVETAINALFEHYENNEYAGVIYTCVKELMINGTKANLKRVLFEKKHVDFKNEKDYLQAMLEFRNTLNEGAYQGYLDALKTHDLWMNVRFDYGSDGVRLEIINNSNMNPIEDKRLREKLKKAMSYDDIAQFYMDQGDELEGAGMGIALIVMLLKGMDVDPALFRIGNKSDGTTFARIEIPMNDNYQSLRDRGLS